MRSGKEIAPLLFLLVEPEYAIDSLTSNSRYPSLRRRLLH